MATQNGDTLAVYLHFRSGSETVASIPTDFEQYDYVASAHARTATHGIEPLPPDLVQISVDRASDFSAEDIAAVLYEQCKDSYDDDSTDLEAIHIDGEVLSGEPDKELIEVTIREALG